MAGANATPNSRMSAVENKPLAQNPRCANAAIPTPAANSQPPDNPSTLIRDKVPRAANIANPAATHSGHAEPTATARAASAAPPTTTASGGARGWIGDH